MNVENLLLYRKRIIPNEIILLKDDVIVEANDQVIITSWNVLHPKKDLHHGYSCYFLKKGLKLSKFYTKDNSLLYWYFDIVEYDYNEQTNSLTSIDLLADVIIYPDQSYQVVDLDEVAKAIEDNLYPISSISKGLTILDGLLNDIYHDQFREYKKYLDKF